MNIREMDSRDGGLGEEKPFFKRVFFPQVIFNSINIR